MATLFLKAFPGGVDQLIMWVDLYAEAMQESEAPPPLPFLPTPDMPSSLSVLKQLNCLSKAFRTKDGSFEEEGVAGMADHVYAATTIAMQCIGPPRKAPVERK